MATPQRGLKDIRTMSDLLSETRNPQRRYLKLAVLTMEKVRRAKERESASCRIEDINARLTQIDAETEELLKMVGATSTDKPDETQSIRPKPAPRRATGGFKFRY